ncbi:MAG: UDP-3-O-(3-hydroxymyristoyl)glucosamine N-acyltransferase [Chitinophagales bacterium]|nr:UDP-3-O-(3-hydroxymyristoyl)glucosamine N-acyltransferase [Chitinophagales bacterium]MDW8419556.1 UDP-3-O-(3-hydroxymyristoyl)glucosamine N-acyltransferase [Chitinophagales bacterium]
MKFENPVPLDELAQLTGSQIIGNGSSLVHGINEIHNVSAGDLTFVDHEKYYDYTLKSAATFVLINKKMDAPPGKTLLYHPEPFEAYNAIAKKYKPELFSTKQIADSAIIGNNTVIHPSAFIGDSVVIGDNCTIHANATIYAYTQIGNNVIIHANATIGCDAFYYKRQPTHYDKMHSAGRVVIADDVEIGAGTTISAGVSSDTYIGRGTKIDCQVHIGHDVKIGEQCILAAQVGIAGNTKIGNRVTLYGKVAVNKNIEIGDDATVMAMSAVPNNIEGGKTYIGYPVVEARTFARQVAIIKKLPELWEKLKNL